MLVIVLENAKPALRGYVANLMTEISFGVFVGDYSKKVRERMWVNVRENIGDANGIMIWTAPTENGFSYATCGKNERKTVDNYGNMLITREAKTVRAGVEKKPHSP